MIVSSSALASACDRDRVLALATLLGAGAGFALVLDRIKRPVTRRYGIEYEYHGDARRHIPCLVRQRNAAYPLNPNEPSVGSNGYSAGSDSSKVIAYPST